MLAAAVLRVPALLFVLGAGWVICFGHPSATEFPPYRLDVDVYRLGGQAFLDGVPLYERTFRTASGAELPFTYPPIAAQLFTVFARMSLDYASAAVAVASVIALFAAVWLVLREVTSLRAMDLLWAAVGALACVIYLMPIRETVAFGQINLFLMVLVLVDVTLGRDRWWRGSLIGFAAAIKLTPLAFVLFFLVRRDLRGALQTLLAMGFWTVLGYWRSPGDSLTYWTQTLGDSGRIGSPDFASNQSITGLLARTGLSSGPQQALWWGSVVALGLLTALIMWLLVRTGDYLGAVVANALFGLLASPVSWSHHWVWVVPALIWLGVRAARLRDGTHSPPQRPGWLPWFLVSFAAVGWWAFFTAPQFRLPHGMGAEEQWSWSQILYGNVWIWWALALLAALAVLPWRLNDASPSSQSPSGASGQVHSVLRSST